MEFTEIRQRVYLLSETTGRTGDTKDPIGLTMAEYQKTADEIEWFFVKSWKPPPCLSACSIIWPIPNQSFIKSWTADLYWSVLINDESGCKLTFGIPPLESTEPFIIQIGSTVILHRHKKILDNNFMSGAEQIIRRNSWWTASGWHKKWGRYWSCEWKFPKLFDH